MDSRRLDKPREPGRRALYLFLTGDRTGYEALDYDRSLLRACYEAADTDLRNRISTQIRNTGRADLMPVLHGNRQKRDLADLLCEWETVVSGWKNPRFREQRHHRPALGVERGGRVFPDQLANRSGIGCGFFSGRTASGGGWHGQRCPDLGFEHLEHAFVSAPQSLEWPHGRGSRARFFAGRQVSCDRGEGPLDSNLGNCRIQGAD